MLNILFPRACVICRARLVPAEPWICLKCQFELPMACFHRTNDPFMKDRFYGRVRVSAATALFYFQKAGATQRLIHLIKYKGLQELGGHLGDWLGSELAEDPNYNDTDLVLPVPLHPRKQRKRGYNQVQRFATQLSKQIGGSIREDILVRTKYTPSLVFKGRHNRSGSQNPFSIREGNCLKDLKILVADDILTTGTTLEHCINAIWKYKPAQVRVATMATA